MEIQKEIFALIDDKLYYQPFKDQKTFMRGNILWR